MHVETVKLREIRTLVDIIHILIASRAEVSYSTRALRALRDIRKYIVLVDIISKINELKKQLAEFA